MAFVVLYFMIFHLTALYFLIHNNFIFNPKNMGLSPKKIKYFPLSFSELKLFFGNLKALGLVTAFMENLQSSRGNSKKSKTLTKEQVEEKIESFLRVKATTH